MCYPLSWFSVGSFAGLPSKPDYLEISDLDPSITILGSQLAGLAWLSYNCKSWFLLRLTEVPRSLREVSKPGSCNQDTSSIARFYPLSLDLADFSKPPEHVTHNFSPRPPQHLHTPFSILNKLSFIHVLSILILSKITENNLKRKA